MLTFRKQPDRSRRRRRSGSPATGPLAPAVPASTGYSYEAVCAEIEQYRGLRYYLYCLASVAGLASQARQQSQMCRCEKLKKASRTHNQDPTKSISSTLFELEACGPTRVLLPDRTLAEAYHLVIVTKVNGGQIDLIISHDHLVRLVDEFPPTLPPAILIQLPQSAAWAPR